MRVFVIDQVDFVALGSLQNVFGECLPDVIEMPAVVREHF